MAWFHIRFDFKSDHEDVIRQKTKELKEEIERRQRKPTITTKPSEQRIPYNLEAIEEAQIDTDE